MAETHSKDGEINTDGYYYQLYTLLHCMDRLRKHENVRQYDIGNAVIGFGALDDVVFTVTLDSGQRTTTAIQVKHSNAKNIIDERYLCQNSRTYLYKYLKSLIEIKKSTSLEQLGQLILWTNMPLAENIRHWFECFKPDSDRSDILGTGSNEGLAYERYRIRKDQWQEIAQKCQHQPKADNRKSASQPKRMKYANEPSTDDDWEQFFKRFVFYVKAPKVDELKANLVGNFGSSFDDLCKLVENFAIKQTTTSDQIDRLFSLINLRNSTETGPYTKLIFSDLDDLHCEVKQFFQNEANNILRVKASQDVDCTVARLTTVVEKCLKTNSKCYLALNIETFNENWNELQLVLNDPKIIEIGLKCLIISSISNDEIRRIQHQVSSLKVIFVGDRLDTHLEDKFDINYINNPNKIVIKNRKIRLSQWQITTANEIFGEELFHRQNFPLVLELYRLHRDSILEVTIDEPKLDEYYLSRSAKKYFPLRIDDVNLLNQTDFCRMIICDEPGMGKTTEMLKLASDFRTKYQDHLVVYLHCRAAVSKWKDSVEDLICNTVAPCSKLTNHVIEKMIKMGKIILLMDGYDEVSSEYKSTLQSVVSKISRDKMCLLYIASRPQCLNEIRSVVGECDYCKLEPFCDDEKLAYLKRIWNVANDSLEIVDRIARKMLWHFNIMMYFDNSNRNRNQFFGDDQTYMHSIMDVPLQMHMIAFIFKDRILSPDFKVSGSVTIGFLYKEFVELKFMKSIKRHYDPTNATHSQIIDTLRKSFLHDHVLAAVKIDQNEPLEEIKALCEMIQHYGIVRTRPSVTFIHMTYLKYFLALHLLTYAMEINRMEHYINMFTGRCDNFILKCIDHLLNHINPTLKPNNSLYESEYHSTNYIPPSTARLHPEKMIEINGALNEMDAVNINAILSSLASKKAFNMLEVIYDGLQMEIRSQVRLCCEIMCRNHSKMVGFYWEYFTTDIVISILNILLKKNSDTFITLCFTSLNDHEKSMLEKMCEDDSLAFVEWLTQIVPELDEEQRAAFKVFVGKRLENCLRLIIRRNQNDLLEKVIMYVKKKCAAEAINQFFTNNNYLRCFMENIEIFDRLPSQNTAEYGTYGHLCGVYPRSTAKTAQELAESKRTGIVHTIYDLYKWAFGEQIPLSSDVINAMQTIQSFTIRKAFQDTFLSGLPIQSDFFPNPNPHPQFLYPPNETPTPYFINQLTLTSTPQFLFPPNMTATSHFLNPTYFDSDSDS